MLLALLFLKSVDTWVVSSQRPTLQSNFPVNMEAKGNELKPFWKDHPGQD